MFSYDYPRPALTADVVAIRDGAEGPDVLLIRRAHDPFAGLWALPGGFVEEWELPEAAARRELAEETGAVLNVAFSLVGVYAKRGRDPRGWTVACVFRARVAHDVPLTPGDDAEEAAWFPIAELPTLAFDHEEIIAEAVAAYAGV